MQALGQATREIPYEGVRVRARARSNKLPAAGSALNAPSGFTLAPSQTTSLYGEPGKLWSSGGDAKVKRSINGSQGVRVRW